jgi:hypothetical protein
MAPLEVIIDGPCVLFLHHIVRGKRQLLGGFSAPIPHCLPQHQKENSKGRCHHTKQRPDPMWWNIGGYTCLFASPTHDGLVKMPQQPYANTKVLDAHHMQPCFKLRSDVVAVPNPMMAFFTRWELPLGLQSTDPRSTAVGAEPCSTPVFNLFSM